MAGKIVLVATTGGAVSRFSLSLRMRISNLFSSRRKKPANRAVLCSFGAKTAFSASLCRKMVFPETLKHHFQTLGVDVEDEAFIGKCMDLCDVYNVTEEVFVEMWVAFMVEKASALEPSMDTLVQMERAVLKKENKSIAETRGMRDSSLTPSSRSPRVNKQFVENEDILEMYGYKGPSTPNVKRVRSPDGLVDPIVQKNKIRALEMTLSPTSSSEHTATPKRIVDDQTRGKILQRFGSGMADWKTSSNWVVQVDKTKDPHVPAQALYMFQLLSKKSANRQRVCREYGARLCSAWCKITGKDAPSITSNVRNQSQTLFRTWGRITAESSDNLMPGSIMLEGCKYPTKLNSLPTIPLDLTGLSSYSIFRGQILAVEGTNPSGDSLVAHNIFTSGYMKPSPSPKIEENIHLIVASGPFTSDDALDYQPLFQLMDHVVETEPHVLILVGPFLPINHPDIQRPKINETYQELFEEIVDKIMNYVRGKSTQVVLIPSPSDAHHDPIYPTPEYFLPKSMQSANLHLVPDPCMLDVEGLTIGATSVDVIRHLSGEEVNHKMTGTDRVARLINHILSQGCFYPLYPPSREVNVDTGLWEKYAFMYQQPHILILPSNMRYFCKWTHDCLVINPERLKKHMYSRIVIRPSFDGTWTQNQIDCEILKV